MSDIEITRREKRAHVPTMLRFKRAVIDLAVRGQKSDLWTDAVSRYRKPSLCSSAMKKKDLLKHLKFTKIQTKSIS